MAANVPAAESKFRHRPGSLCPLLHCMPEPPALEPPLQEAFVALYSVFAAGEVMLGDLFRSGFDIVEDHEDADAIVVNTCSFVEEAKTESLEVPA